MVYLIYTLQLFCVVLTNYHRNNPSVFFRKIERKIKQSFMLVKIDNMLKIYIDFLSVLIYHIVKDLSKFGNCTKLTLKIVMMIYNRVIDIYTMIVHMPDEDMICEIYRDDFHCYTESDFRSGNVKKILFFLYQTE